MTAIKAIEKALDKRLKNYGEDETYFVLLHIVVRDMNKGLIVDKNGKHTISRNSEIQIV